MPDAPDKPNRLAPRGEPKPEPTAAGREPVPNGEGEGEGDRPTVNPPFDPVAFAREVLKPSPSPMAAVTLPTPNPRSVVTPPRGNARPPRATTGPRKKTPPGLGEPPLPAREPRRKTPTSTLSLANARIPSNLPPRLKAIGTAAKRPKPAPAPETAVDQEWADLELSTRPPPADGPNEDPVVEIAQERPLPLDLEVSPAQRRFDEHAADTVRRPIPQEIIGPEARAREMSDRVSLGDYSGALEIAEAILAGAPDDAVANACAENCRTVLRQMYAARIGPLDRVPVVMVPRDQLRWLSIDHKAGFVLSLVDGVSSLEMIIDVSGMPELDTLRILSELAQQRVISLR